MNKIVIACLSLIVMSLLGIIALLYVNIIQHSKQTEILQSINNYTIDTHEIIEQATEEGININLEIIE